jgi:3',5'-cyclic AMP phosphodiesterase CpdA
MDENTTHRFDRRGMLRCCAGWAGTAALYTVSGGVVGSIGLDAALAAAPRAKGPKPFTFLQISDTHIGFDKAANPDARGTAITAVEKIKALAEKPDLILHTGDITHLSTDAQFDDARQILSEIGVPIFFVPGEHDMLDEGQGKSFLAHHGQGTQGTGWRSFDHSGVHFIGLNNVADLKPGGMAHIGDDQLDWMARDLKGLPTSTPIVIFAHIPLWTVYEAWGWGTDDSAQALSLLAPFGSVTVLNGHIHQVLQKVEGNVSFHSARSTAYPQPAPGTAPSPGPLKVPTEQLPTMLGIRTARFVRGSEPIALVDQTFA